MHGWYSKKQAELGGVIRYKTASGAEVEASCVAKGMDGAPLWDDAVYLGEVTDYVCRVSEGSLSRDMDEDTPEEFLRKLKIIQGKAPINTPSAAELLRNMKMN